MSAPSPYPHAPYPSALPQNGIGTAGLATGIIGLILSVTFVGYVVAIPLDIPRRGLRRSRPQ